MNNSAVPAGQEKIVALEKPDGAELVTGERLLVMVTGKGREGFRLSWLNIYFICFPWRKTLAGFYAANGIAACVTVTGKSYVSVSS
jgi:hypothetical protein